MRITIDDSNGIPIWLQLRNRLIYLITSGHFQVGEKLPTMREMAVDLGINYNTVSKVYQDIERDGYIVSKRGRGTFVSDAYLQNQDAAAGEAESLTDAYIQQCRELGVPREDIAALVQRRLRLIQ
ncbi:MAG: GntR family transcriptional regulator [Eggerthellaceae bacterium]|nr:GntR family transcriptional regulator [Eggerthellaceae bacterium]